VTEARIVLTTVSSKEEGQKIARMLVESHAAACVNISGPIESVYRWQGTIETATEHLLIIKTVNDALERVRKTVTQLHSYDVPEIVVLNIDGGSHPYLKWLTECVLTAQ
jgi:periplasmic divalent cation tolerance protein